jgi:hypothetical protein
LVKTIHEKGENKDLEYFIAIINEYEKEFIENNYLKE